MCINDEINVNCSAIGRHVRVAIENIPPMFPIISKKYMVAAVSFNMMRLLASGLELSLVERICTVHLHKAAYAWHPPKPLQITRPDPHPAAVIRAVLYLCFSSCSNRQELHQAL